MDTDTDIHVPPVPITHAERHPELPVQPIMERKKRVLTDAQKVSLQVGRALAAEKRVQLNNRLADFIADQDKKLEKIAEEEGVTLEHCRKLLSTSLKGKREPNIQNALVSLKASELNAGRAPGQKAKLSEIQAAVAADEGMQDATPEEITKLKELLEEKRLLKAQGARATHGSEAKDIAAFSRKMSQEFFNLYQRTGAVGFGFVTRGNIDCSGVPCWWVSGSGADFVKERLNMGMWDLLRTFESWVTAQANGPSKGPSNNADRKKACAALILSNLCYITHSQDVQMSYSHYDRDIILAHKVHIIGWPAQVPFIAPSTLTRAADIRDLLDALKSGACRWAKVTKAELSEAQDRVAVEEPKKRRERSDAGGTHAKRKRAAADTGDADQSTSRQRRRISKPKGKGKVAPAFSSPEVVDSDDDDD
ncbi:hypothetical protein C8J56DRAFT_879917 [Mycena floridula]|nr:hypothetical protein C8J56DRAFT_879917 [Mycena floridula]